MGSKSQVMVAVRQDFPQFFSTVPVEDIDGVDTFVVDGSTLLRQRLPGLATGGTSADALIASRCGFPTQIKLCDVGWLLFSFVKTLLQDRSNITVVLGLDSAVPFPARAITRIGRIACSDTHITDLEARIADVQTNVDVLYRALYCGQRITTEMLNAEIHADCLKLIAYDGTKSIFQQLVLLCTIAVAAKDKVYGRLFVLGVQRHEMYDMDLEADEVVARYGWGTFKNNELTLSDTHPWCPETGLLRSHCKKIGESTYKVSDVVLDLLVFQEAQYQAVKVHHRLVDLQVRGVDTSLEKDFLAASVFGPGNFAVENELDPSTSLWFGGGDVDCFTSAVLLSVVGGWPEGLKLSTTTMHKYSRTKQFEIVTDLKALSYSALPYVLGFNAGCDYCLGFFGYAHRSFLKLSLLNHVKITENKHGDRYTLTMSYKGKRIVVLHNTTDETTAVQVCEEGYFSYIDDVIKQRVAATKAVTQSAIEVARRRFEWFLGVQTGCKHCTKILRRA